jgi:hypothetical protein
MTMRCELPRKVSASRLYEICKVLNVALSSMFERDPKA